ncbi:MAG: hypothetical protein CBE21_00090 [Proteobacteria bacterium TMED261]|nr:MAG: hypothetical protein CBE21_00090 [Proteobacteria bacterium TMED261]|tara:strand:- start:1062 stop:1448 length:387 start_codon:yes stop_codon:yes gene_type:complete
MPLSEDEERILNEIEDQLYESDPALAREVSETTVYTHPLRNLKWSIAGFIAAAVVMILTLSTSYILSFIGFLGMLGSALSLERNARHLGRTGIQQAAQSGKGSAFRQSFGSTTAKMRERFQRGEQGRP